MYNGVVPLGFFDKGEFALGVDTTTAYETKVILALLARHVANAKTVREAYDAILDAANVEGVSLPTYDEYVKKLSEGVPSPKEL